MAGQAGVVPLRLTWVEDGPEEEQEAGLFFLDGDEKGAIHNHFKWRQFFSHD